MAELTDQDRAELREMIEQKWVATCKTRDWEACMALCTEDLVYMPPDHTVLHGKAETQAWLSQFPEMKNFTQELVDITGDTSLAVVRGTAKVTILVEIGPFRSIQGKHITVVSDPIEITVYGL